MRHLRKKENGILNIWWQKTATTCVTYIHRLRFGRAFQCLCINEFVVLHKIMIHLIKSMIKMKFPSRITSFLSNMFAASCRRHARQASVLPELWERMDVPPRCSAVRAAAETEAEATARGAGGIDCNINMIHLNKSTIRKEFPLVTYILAVVCCPPFFLLTLKWFPKVHS